VCVPRGGVRYLGSFGSLSRQGGRNLGLSFSLSCLRKRGTFHVPPSNSLVPKLTGYREYERSLGFHFEGGETNVWACQLLADDRQRLFRVKGVDGDTTCFVGPRAIPDLGNEITTILLTRASHAKLSPLLLDLTLDRGEMISGFDSSPRAGRRRLCVSLCLRFRLARVTPRRPSRRGFSRPSGSEGVGKDTSCLHAGVLDAYVSRNPQWHRRSFYL